MTTASRLEAYLEQARVDDAVRYTCPEYVAFLVAASNLSPGPSNAQSDALLARAETVAAERLAGRSPHELPEVAAWRQAYQSLGVKPREARSSIESLLRRSDAGLPRIDRLTDVYNALSVLHLLPLGGEDLTGYVGPPRLVVADGSEPFDTVADGEPVVHRAAPGEIVWRDDEGVTCRRWNWRQCVRTRLTQHTTQALFVIDALAAGDPIADTRIRARAAADDLVEQLTVGSPQAVFATRMLYGPELV
jgi:DNA/RNA-binding domain of Phe-tRNA-synthetase-like protein